MKATSNDVTKLLWTGGWDSTFRLLQLVLTEKQPVQPIYIINPDRESALAEIRAMKNIRRRLVARHPEVADRLRLSKSVGLLDFEPADKHQRSYQRILQNQYLGTQYVWLASYCEAMELNDVELSIHRDDKAHRILEPYVSIIGRHGGYRVDEKHWKTDEYNLFRFFRFPVFDYTKTWMREIAAAQGFDDLMKLTWFCHTPSRGQRACGICNPCIYTMQEGLGDRIPLWGRLRYRFRGLGFLRLQHT